jgi:hypothetical protein
MESGMPDCGFGRCDGHHKMIDFRLKKKHRLALVSPAASPGGPGRGHSRRQRSIEHVAGGDDFEVAEATYRRNSFWRRSWSALDARGYDQLRKRKGLRTARWPAARITLRQGARIVRESEQQE